MAKQFHVKVKDMTPEERKAYKLHNRKHGLIAKLNRLDKELAEIQEKRMEINDPEYAALKEELKDIEARISELRLKKRKLEYDGLSEKEKRIYDRLGMNPHKNQLIHRSTGNFLKTGSYTIKED